MNEEYKMRVALVTNILTPYRKRFFDELDKQLRQMQSVFHVYVMTSDLPLRPWLYDELKSDYTELMTGKKILIKGQDILVNLSVNSSLKAFHPDIVILAGSWTYPTSWLMMLRKLNQSTKYYFWVESHNIRGMETISKRKILFDLKKFFYLRFDGFCIPGKYASETVDSIVGNYGTRIHLANLVDDDFYEEANEMRVHSKSLRRKYCLSPDKRIFITPARLISIKGIDLFFEQIKANNYISDSTFILAGEGPVKSKIKKIAEYYKLDIRLMGYCNQDIVREFYALADCFLLPSLLDPNPLTSIEASFSGLPLLVSRYVGNSPELVRNKENGIVFDTKDKKSTEDAFEFMMKASPEWLGKAGKISLQIAQEGFKCSCETEKIIKSFESILKKECDTTQRSPYEY